MKPPVPAVPPMVIATVVSGTGFSAPSVIENEITGVRSPDGGKLADGTFSTTPSLLSSCASVHPGHPLTLNVAVSPPAVTCSASAGAAKPRNTAPLNPRIHRFITIPHSPKNVARHTPACRAKHNIAPAADQCPHPLQERCAG